MKRICIDMDEVLSDTLSEHLARYNREFGEALTKADLKGKWPWQIVPADRRERLDSYLRLDDFFEDLPVIEDSQRVVRALVEHYEVFVATAAMEFPTSFRSKYRWLQRHFPCIRPAHFVFCGDKGILRADYLIDDQPRQIQHFAGRGILFTAPHNLGLSGYCRVDNWAEVARMFLPGVEL